MQPYPVCNVCMPKRKPHVATTPGQLGRAHSPDMTISLRRGLAGAKQLDIRVMLEEQYHVRNDVSQ